ncbi:MAG TPA: redoxin domain-containing protein [Ignavibacteriales bacterium]|nr:redoxin domain-containing protein [Ignavibacteriales bacterium]HOL82096.1 redoxin domain-containing protein [Ignavibacteriales bacterium]HOM65098.1 redoxin domain-containing protein [Ignavibacteriales bacterium]HPD68227.1 redoxin domain-containing protein [Ignavibacteriales bacterium]HPP34318.1 redoxin domain-containing protein [Ignavibacteriales bacterium]
MLKVGDKAPVFTLKNQNLEDVNLENLIGKKNIVLLFFPFANTSVCEKELCSTRDSMKDYEDLDAEILAISVDSPFALKLWNDKHKFSFNLLSDFNKEVAPKYGAFYEVFAPGKFDYKGVAKRSAFVIDKNGVIQYVEVLENAGDEPNYEAIKETLKKL